MWSRSSTFEFTKCHDVDGDRSDEDDDDDGDGVGDDGDDDDGGDNDNDDDGDDDRSIDDGDEDRSIDDGNMIAVLMMVMVRHVIQEAPEKQNKLLIMDLAVYCVTYLEIVTVLYLSLIIVL